LDVIIHREVDDRVVLYLWDGVWGVRLNLKASLVALVVVCTLMVFELDANE
jgi:hypothetical protein